MSRALLVGILLVASATLVAFAPTATASANGGFGVTPVELRFVDPPALRGSHLEGVFKVQNRQGSDVEISAVPEGVASSWMRLEPAGAFIVRNGESRDVRVILDIPADAANGDYTSYIRINGAPASSLEGSGSSLAVELVPAVRLRVGGEQTLSFAMDRLAVQSPEAGAPLVLAATLVNQGNVRAVPSLQVEVSDANGRPVLTETLHGDAMEPRAGGPVTFATDGLLPAAGTYTVKAVLKSGERVFAEKGLTFEVVPRGSTGEAPARGKVTGLGFDAAPEKGSPAKVTAGFRNLGGAPIRNAKLVAEVFLGETRVAVLQSDPLSVAPGEEQTLEAFWTPKDEGTYRIVSQVTFDGVKSATRTDTLVVAGGQTALVPKEETKPATETKQEEQTATPPKETPAPLGVALLGALGAAALVLRARRRD